MLEGRYKMSDFPTIDHVHLILDEISEEIPREFFEKLNEGVILLPRTKLHPESTDDKPLYVLGEYRRSFTGRNIVIYYGSFSKAFNGISERQLRKRLKETLLHEFTHHIESLAGERGLEKKDAENIQHYRDSHNKK